MTEEVIERGQSKGRIAGGVVVVLLLIAAAFVGGRLLAPTEPGQNELQLPPGMAFEGDEDGERFSISISDVTRAPGIPVMEPDARGLYVRRSDDTIVIGTGNVMAFYTGDLNAVPEFNYDGIEVEVLVTNQTKLYEDVSDFTPGQTSFQQKVEPLENLDNLGSSTTLQVWGRHEGDRIIAETIVLMEPPSLPKLP